MRYWGTRKVWKKKKRKTEKEKRKEDVRDWEETALLFSSSSLYKEFEEMMKKETEEWDLRKMNWKEEWRQKQVMKEVKMQL